LFTIIVPTHDRPLLLHRTLLSLACQSFQDFRVVIVSDSSNYFPPYEALSGLRGRYVYAVHNDGNGPASSRNMGLQLADTPFVMFLDDDDTFEPDHLAMLSKTLDSSIGKIAFCDFMIQEEDRTQHPPLAIKTSVVEIGGVTRNDVFVLNRIPNSCLIYPVAAVKERRFDHAFILYEDWEFLLSCLKDWDLVHIPVNSVVIHKSYVAGAENIRRGNSNDDKLLDVTLELYRRFPAPNPMVQQARQTLLAKSGVKI